MDIILNSIGIVSSIVGLVFAFHIFIKGSQRNKVTRIKIVKQYAGVFAFCSFGLALLSYRYVNRISTIVQEDTFENYSDGVHEIFYPAAYQSPPHLRINLKNSWYTGGEIKILEQKSDRFRVNILGSPELWKWRAEGRPEIINNARRTR